uniref:Uncharacterized protein n=1 Tax=Rhizophora mucronata TaxID=61149 RepID=A0A2P2QAS9_RHIMU
MLLIHSVRVFFFCVSNLEYVHLRMLLLIRIYIFL